MSLPPVLGTALRVGQACDRSHVAYQVVGSVASSLHGDPRLTNDIDFVVDLSPDRVAALADQLGPDFEVDQEALQDAMRRRRSWNIFYLPQFIRIDLFALAASDYEQAAFARRQSEIVGEEEERLVVQSPEDVVLRKLRWFRDGGELINQQWRDVVQVLRIQAGLLDEAWLDRWAPLLDIDDLLARARREAADPAP